MASLTATVKFDVATVVGVPLMTAVEEFSVKPAGKDPDEMLNVGEAHPAVPTAWE